MMDRLKPGSLAPPAAVPSEPPVLMERKRALALFQKTVGIKFKKASLLNLSFTHRSVSNESVHRGNNERLEFLGDAVLGMVCAALLYEKFADKAEGELAKIKSVVVSEAVLAGVARELRINTLLILGRGEELSGGREKRAILADALEALIGAIFLDSGYKAAFKFVSRWIGPEIVRVHQNRHHQDYKSLLQELCQRRFRCYPEYNLLKRSGPDHERIFWTEVCINGQPYGQGMGKTKKSAEQEAARIAYEALADQGASL